MGKLPNYEFIRKIFLKVIDKLCVYIYNTNMELKRRRKTLNYLLKLPKDLHTQIKVTAFSSGKTMLQFILEAINEKLEKENK